MVLWIGRNNGVIREGYERASALCYSIALNHSTEMEIVNNEHLFIKASY